MFLLLLKGLFHDFLKPYSFLAKDYLYFDMLKEVLKHNAFFCVKI